MFVRWMTSDLVEENAELKRRLDEYSEWYGDTSSTPGDLRTSG